MPWLGVPAAFAAAYLAVKAEGSTAWTALSVACWSLVAFVILGSLSLVFGFLIVGLRAL